MKMPLRLILLLLAFCLGTDGLAQGHTFKVESHNGAPVITMDGQLVRSRIFWGQTIWRGGGMKLSPNWQDYSYEFTCPENSDKAELQLRFGNEPGTVRVSKVKLTDLDSGAVVRDCRFDGGAGDLAKAWQFWCPNEKDSPPLSMAYENGALRVDLKKDKRLGELRIFTPELKVEQGHRYRVEIRAKSDSERFLRSSLNKGPRFYDLNILPTAFESQIRLAASQNINIVSFYINSVWQQPGKAPDFSEIDLMFKHILKVNPKAMLLPRINMSNTPGWWRHTHQGDYMVFDDGVFAWGAPCVASEAYKAEAVAALRRTIRYCEEKYGEHMVGYHPAGGSSDEWFYVDSWDNHLNGYDPATRKSWRKWLKAKYGNDGALQKAWGNPGVTCDNAEVPSSAARNADAKLGLRRPAVSADAPVIDFANFQQESMSDMVLALAKVIREETKGRRLSVFFYGYIFEFSAIWAGPAISGHYALRRLLNSPDIDILAAPITYGDRQIGGGGGAMTAAESVALAGKMWLHEDDTNTHLAAAAGNVMAGWNNGAKTQSETIQLLRRGLAVATCRNFGVWWMDLLGSGWFDDPTLWPVMGQFKAMEENFLANPVAYRPEIAAIIDEMSLRYILAKGASGATSGPLIANGRIPLNRLGAPYGQYLQDDFVDGKTNAKLNVFLSAYALDGATRKKMKELSGRAGAIWCWAPGYLDLDKGEYSLEAVEELTGFKVKSAGDVSMQLKATKQGLDIGLPAEFGVKFSVTPTLSPIPKNGDRVLASYSNGLPAIVLRPGKYPSLFCGGSTIPSVLYRHVARMAGVHLYTDKDANVYANGRYVAVSAAQDGELTLNVGASGKLWDEFASKSLGYGPKLKLKLFKGETRLIRIEGNK